LPVDRANELAEFDVILARVAQGIRRHLGVLGLRRRIGKAVLVDQASHRWHRARVRRLHAVKPLSGRTADLVDMEG
jgi:hypothetical protein